MNSYLVSMEKIQDTNDTGLHFYFLAFLQNIRMINKLK